ncbi:MAG: hypothetical protein KY475_21850 [Planctomycetes bacterium]|nr:hypothetical protein [Planctomycetota bacterium]
MRVAIRALLISARFRQTVRRILQRPAEVFIGRLQVVLGRDRNGIANPLAHDMCRELLGQLGLPRAAEVLKQLRPRLQTRPLDDPLKLRAEVRLAVAAAANDGLLAEAVLLGVEFLQQHVQGCLEDRSQFWEQRDDPRVAAWVVLRFRTVDGDPAILPIHVAPFQREVLARTAKAAEAAQGEDQLPFQRWAGFEDLLGVLAGEEVKPLGIPPSRALQGHKRVFC